MGRRCRFRTIGFEEGLAYAGRVSLVNELLSAAKCEPAMAGPLWAANSAPKLDKAATKLNREEMAAAV